jgi:hypothetical protein
MRQVNFILIFLVFSVWLIGPVWAQDPIFYPAKGQSEDQLEKDKYECYNWAKKKTGFDPMKTPKTKSAPPAKEEKVWGAGETAVAGGVGGAVIGGVAGGGKGAVAGGLIGAGGGALIGSARSSDQREREERKRKEWERSEGNSYARERNQYNRALGACMEGRGYSVK